MSEIVQSEIMATPQDALADCNAQLDVLRAAGAERFDPVRMRYLAAFLNRAMQHQGHSRNVLHARFLQELTLFKTRFEQAQTEAQEIVTQGSAQYPHLAGQLQQQYAQGDFKKLRRFVSALSITQANNSLGALLRQLEQSAPASTKSAVQAGSRPELKTIQKFRNTWSKLSVDKQVMQALEQAPKNAGPINSHMLVLRSLALMREISPDYLNRFISYADTLLCLDQGNVSEKPVAAVKKSPAVKRSRKAK